MLLLPLTPPLIYLKLKKIKGSKMDSCSSRCSSRSSSLCSSRSSSRCSSRIKNLRSIAGIKERFERNPLQVYKEIPFKCSTCKTSAGVYKEIQFKIQHVQD